MGGEIPPFNKQLKFRDMKAVEKLKSKGSSLKGYSDSEFAKLERVWNETGIKPKGYDKAKADWKSKGI